MQETARQRLVVTSAIFIMVFCAVGLRMGYVSLLRDGGEPTQRVAARGGYPVRARRHRRPQRRGARDLAAGDVGLRQSAPGARHGGRRAQDRLGPAGAQVRGAQGEARRRQELRLDQARPDAARALPGQSPRPPRPRLPGRGAAHLSAGRRPARISSASPTSTMPASPASSATSTSACRAARPVQLSIDLRLQRMVEDELGKRGARSSRRSAAPPS